MDKIRKVLNKLNFREKQKLKKILLQIERECWEDLDLKKLKGKKNIFRVRKGDMRIIFYKVDNSIKILSLEHRNSKTYKKMKF